MTGSGDAAAPDTVVLVDPEGTPIGTAEKLAAHRGAGRLHLAFSILVFDPRGRLLLQRRAPAKYHFRGLWSNTCCGHPRPGEPLLAAARRRLGEEFGFTTTLAPVRTLVYEARDDATGLVEHEFLHVLRGEHAGAVAPDAAEIAEWRWETPETVREEMEREPERFTPWFRLVLEG